jgi:glutathione S-transferase
MNEIEILGFAPSTYVRTARMAAMEKSVSHRLMPLEFKSPAHFAVHPFGRMPVLRHGALVVHETLAILDYIDNAFDGPPLQPRDARKRASMMSIVSATIDYLYEALVRSTLGDTKPNPAATAQALNYMEQAAAAGDLDAASTITFADLFVAPILGYHVRQDAGKTDVDARPRLSRWYSRISIRPSFQQTQPV